MIAGINITRSIPRGDNRIYALCVCVCVCVDKKIKFIIWRITTSIVNYVF